MEDFRVRHSGDVLTNVIEGAYRIVDEFEEVEASKDLMQSIELNPGQQRAFARAALQLRYDEGEHAPIDADKLNLPRRTADQGADLWRTFNRVQENILQGGLRGRNKNGGRTPWPSRPVPAARCTPAARLTSAALCRFFFYF